MIKSTINLNRVWQSCNHCSDCSISHKRILTIILTQSLSRETRLWFSTRRSSNLSNICPLHPRQPSYRGGEDDSYSNQLRPPKAMTIVVTSCLAYSLIIFICLDGFHPSLYYPSIVKLIGQKFGLHSPLLNFFTSLHKL